MCADIPTMHQQPIHRTAATSTYGSHNFKVRELRIFGQKLSTLLCINNNINNLTCTVPVCAQRLRWH